MFCLFFGEYGEHTLQEIHMQENQIDKILQIQKEAYKNYIGKSYGDYICEKIEYDWGRHKQVWTVRCRTCGAVSEKLDGYNWSRGKSGSYICPCKREKKAKEEKRKKEELIEKKENLRLDKIEKHLGKIYGDWKVIDYNGYAYCELECLVCGEKKKNIKIANLDKGALPTCTHRGKNDYSNPKWQVVRIGHLTAIRQDGAMYITKCDCGRERYVYPSIFFRKRVYRDCGYADCPFANDDTRAGRKARNKGNEYENRISEFLKASGYETETTGSSCDYGVDIIAKDKNGLEIAVQCKGQNDPADVNAVQQVYAGGRYRGLENFAIISETGFSYGAMKMARALGVYLCDGKTFDYPDDISKYSESILPIYSRGEQFKKYYEINGEVKTLSDWCFEYNTSTTTVRKLMNDGLSLENSLKWKKKKRESKYTVNGFTGNLEEIGEKFGILPQTIQYRMKYRGMGLEEAVTTPVGNNGRKKKEE